MSKPKDVQREEALAILRANIKAGQRVYTILRHVTASGMQRSISVATVSEDGRLHDWSWAAARALGWKCDDKRGGVKVDGCGMDAGFHLVYALGARIWPDGTPEPHSRRNGLPDTAGGYALNHEWF